jgi:radical SAM protein with 4Fe4S-binding SPASM domain
MNSIDNHKLILHPSRVSEWMSKGDCAPLYVEFGLTNNCNHKCVFCALDYLENGKQYIGTEIMLKALEDMAKYGVKSIMFAGEGEPLLHRDVGLFAKIAKKNGIDVSITTNGVSLTKKKIEQCLPYLSWIRFSIDSGSAENYAKIHGTNKKDYEKVLENIQNAVEFKRINNLETTIGAQFLMIPQNREEASRLAKRLKKIGVDNLQIKPYSHHPSSTNNLCVDMHEYNLIEDSLKEFEDGNFKLIFRKATIERVAEEKNYLECRGLSFMALVDANGNVMPCNIFYQNKDFFYGNLNKQNFRDIWEGEKRQKVIKNINKEGLKNCRGGCRLDPINRYLQRLKNPEGHDSFI